MAWPKGKPNPHGGNRRGIPNKATKTVRANVLAVFDQIGGQQAMAEWAASNQTEFYRLYGRMAPADPEAPGGADNPMRHVFAWQK